MKKISVIETIDSTATSLYMPTPMFHGPIVGHFGAADGEQAKRDRHREGQEQEDDRARHDDRVGRRAGDGDRAT